MTGIARFVAPPAMRFRLLGPFRIDGVSAAHTISRRRERCLLALLLLEQGRLITVDRLITLLWDDEPPADARRTLQSHVARLRAVLKRAPSTPPAAIVTSGSGYLLQADPDTIDVHRFRSLVRQARQQEPADRRASLLTDALALWRGVALADVADEGLRQRVCADLDELRIGATEDWLAAELALGRHHERVADISRLIGELPDRERIVELGMLALHRSGRTSEALRLFHELRARLAEHAGLDPGHSVVELQAAILRADPSLRLPPAGERAAGPSGSSEPPASSGAATSLVARLPPDVMNFIGREPALHALDLVGDGDGGRPALALVTGPPGVGKTAVAVRWAHLATRHFSDGQIFLDLRGYADDPPMSLDVAVDLLLWGLGVPPERVPGDRDRKLATYRSLLAMRRALVVLDNVRDAATVRALACPAGSTSMVLATSRDRLDSLAVRDSATHIELDMLDHDDAVRLLIDVGRLSGDRIDRDSLTRLAGLCDRMPLALRIIACRLAARPTDGVASMEASLRDAERRLAVLEIDPSDAGVRAVFETSYQGLSPVDARMFRLLGRHPGHGASVAAAAAMAGLPVHTTDESLRRLESQHLLTFRQDGRAYLHDLLRTYARGLAGTDEHTLDRVLDFYLDTVHGAYHLLSPRTPELPERRHPPTEPIRFTHREAALAWFDAERVNLSAAVYECHALDLHETARRLSENLFAFYHQRRLWSDWIAVFSRALESVTLLGDPLGECRILNGLGVAHKQIGDYPSAVVYYRKALEAAERTADPANMGPVHINLGGLYNTSGRPDLAEEHLRRALAIPGYGDNPRFGQLLWLNLGHLYFNQQRLDEADTALRRGVELTARTGDRHTAAYLHHGLGEVAFQRRDPDDAVLHAEAALAGAEEVGDPLRRAYALDLLGSTVARGDPSRARAHWRDAVAIATELGHPLVAEATYWLDRPLPDTDDEWYAVEGARRFRINQLP